MTTHGFWTCQPATTDINNRTENHHAQNPERFMTTHHLDTATPCQRINNADDGGPVKTALPQRVPGAALAELKVRIALDALAVFLGATDVRNTQRMPSRAEWEAAKAGLLALAETATPQPEECGVDA